MAGEIVWTTKLAKWREGHEKRLLVSQDKVMHQGYRISKKERFPAINLVMSELHYT